MSKHISKKDIEEWIKLIKFDGIKKFIYSELPDKFKNEQSKKYLSKANYCGLLKRDKRINSDNGLVVKWEIII